MSSKPRKYITLFLKAGALAFKEIVEAGYSSFSSDTDLVAPIHLLTLLILTILIHNS